MNYGQACTAFLLGTALMVSAQLSMTHPADAQVLRGETKLACEAIICLFAGSRAPGECASALTRYFSISAANPALTATARQNFLNQCPRR